MRDIKEQESETCPLSIPQLDGILQDLVGVPREWILR